MKKRKPIEVRDIEAVFVDMDGTLIDNIKGLYQVYHKFLNEFGIKGHKLEFNELNGPSLPEIVKILKARHKLPGSQASLTQRYRALFHVFYSKEVKLFPGVLEVLKAMREIPLKLVLVTSSTKDVVGLVFKNHHLQGMFDVIVTGDKVKKSKPDPEIFLNALKAAKMKPQQVIAIEDSPHGVNAALNAGIFVIRINPKVERFRIHENVFEAKDWNVVNGLIRFWYD